jgi:hypothetical protein
LVSSGFGPRITFAQTVDVRYSAVKFVLPLGLLIASAIFDLGSRANAGYLPVCSPSSVQDSQDNLGMADSGDTSSRLNKYLPRIEVDPILHQMPGGSTTSVPTTQQGGDGPPVGLTPVADQPAPALVTYIREPSGSLDLFHFIAAILDPPRTV